MGGSGEESFEYPLIQVYLQNRQDNITIRDKNSWNEAKFNEAKKKANIANSLICESEQYNNRRGGISQKKMVNLIWCTEA